MDDLVIFCKDLSFLFKFLSDYFENFASTESKNQPIVDFNIDFQFISLFSCFTLLIDFMRCIIVALAN